MKTVKHNLKSLTFALSAMAVLSVLGCAERAIGEVNSDPNTGTEPPEKQELLLSADTFSGRKLPRQIL